MFQSATNYGRGHIVPDLTPDSDSILVKSYFQICDLNAAATEVHLNYMLEALSENAPGSLGHNIIYFLLPNKQRGTYDKMIEMPRLGLANFFCSLPCALGVYRRANLKAKIWN